MIRPIRPLDEVLFDMFANETIIEPQESQYLWAIYEGIRRLDPMGFKWKTIKARKEHECIRGHTIKIGNVYCQHIVMGWGTDWKFCLGCMAMLLYFWNIDELEPSMFTHWDHEKREPVLIEERRNSK
jgi:hypothetical protein